MSAETAPLRVHILIDSLTWGGAEMLLGDLAASAPSAGIELSVGYLAEVDGSPAAASLRRHGIEPQLVPVRQMLEPGALPRLRRHLAHVRPQIVHTHLILADIVGTLAARSLGLPAVSTIHLVARQPAVRGSDTRARGRCADHASPPSCAAGPPFVWYPFPTLRRARRTWRRAGTRRNASLLFTTGSHVLLVQRMARACAPNSASRRTHSG